MILPLFCILIWNAFLCQSVNPEVDKQSQTGSEGQEGIAVGPAAGSEGEEGNLAVEPEQRINVQEDEPLTASGNNRQGHEAGSDTAISEHGDSISAESAPKENIPEQGPSVTEYVNGMSIDGVISDYDIRSASREPGSSDISSGQADVVSAPGEPEGNGHVILKASGDGLGRELESSEEKSLKKPKERNKAAGDADQSNQDIEESKSFSEDGQLLPQTPHLPPSVPAVEFAIDPAADIITSNLHVNSGSVASREALELVRKIHEINENNRSAEASVGTGCEPGGARLQRPNKSHVKAQVGSSFDFLSVYHNEQYTFIQISVPAEFARISENLCMIIEVSGSLPFLIYYNPFDQQMWLVFSASFSDINEIFLKGFFEEDFPLVFRNILRFMLNEGSGPVLLVNEATFLILTMLLCHISILLYGGIHLFDGFVRDLVINNKVNTDKREFDEYTQQPRGDSTRPTSQNPQTGTERVLTPTDKLNLWDKWYRNGFNFKNGLNFEDLKALLAPPEEHVKHANVPTQSGNPQQSSAQRPLDQVGLILEEPDPPERFLSSDRPPAASTHGASGGARPKINQSSAKQTKKVKDKRKNHANVPTQSGNPQQSSAQSPLDQVGLILEEPDPPDGFLSTNRPPAASTHGASGGARSKINQSSAKQTKKVKDKRKNHANVPTQSGNPQQSSAQSPLDQVGLILEEPDPPDGFLSTNRPPAASTHDKTSQGAPPKNVSTMTQSKVEDQDPPSGA